LSAEAVKPALVSAKAATPALARPIVSKVPARTAKPEPKRPAASQAAERSAGPIRFDKALVNKTPLDKPLVKKVEIVPALAKAFKNEKIDIKPEIKRKLDFRAQDWVVYPAHGVGRIVSIEEQEVAGLKLELFVINFEKDKMTLRVPVAKAKTIGMRRLSSPDVVESALRTLKGRARIKRTMWSRRAQEYEQKIHSGDLISIAEVVRDLHRASGQPEQSYSERQLYEAAIARLARELAAVEKIDEDSAMKRLETALLKAA
jgi:CarD family transcriptional regulator